MSKRNFSRRDLLRASAVTGAAGLIGKAAWGQTCADSSPIEIGNIAFTGCGVGGEPFPTSPFILQPFTQALPIPEGQHPFLDEILPVLEAAELLLCALAAEE